MLSFLKSSLIDAGCTVLGGMPANVTPTPHASGIFLQFHFPHAAARHVAPVGRPEAFGFTAAYRAEPFWMRPAVVREASSVPVETQVLFAELEDRRVAVYVPLVDGDVRCSLQGDAAGLALVAESGNPGVQFTSVTGLFVAVQQAGESLHDFLARAAAAVAERLKVKLRHEKTLPDFVNHFGWCTWDAFYKDVTPEKVLEGLATLRDAGVPARFVILDDGWQSETSCGEEKGRRLTSLMPNEKFGGSLAPMIAAARQQFGVRHVIVWHAMQGYWGGIDPASMPEYQPRETPRHFSPGVLHHWPEANVKWWGHVAGVVPPERVGSFFDDCHALLKSQGVDGVKVDNQATLESFSHGTSLGRVALTAAYRAALEASVQKHFGSGLLNCMSCANDTLYYTGPSSLTRTSVDYWPTKPETHGTHLWTNALVSLWFGHFIHPDWDMFQSTLPEPHAAWSSFHAAGRAISGGPVYVSDRPGQHDAGLIRRLTLSDGTVPRCDRPAAISRDCLFKDPTRDSVPLKVINTCRNGSAGVVGIFNCRFDPQGMPVVDAIISPADVPEIAGHERYVLHYRGTALNAPPIPARACGMRDSITLILGASGWEIVTLVPIEDGLAIIGLIDTFIPAATISHIQHLGRATRLRVRDGGTLGFWCERPVTVHFQGRQLALAGSGPWLTVAIPSAGDVLLK